MVGQRVFGIALGYEDLNDHDELRHDPMLAVRSSKLAAGLCAADLPRRMLRTSTRRSRRSTAAAPTKRTR